MSFRSEVVKILSYKDRIIEFTKCGDTWEAWIKREEADASASFLRFNDDFDIAREKAEEVIDGLIKLEQDKLEAELQERKRLKRERNQNRKFNKPLHDWLEGL